MVSNKNYVRKGGVGTTGDSQYIVCPYCREKKIKFKKCDCQKETKEFEKMGK